TVVNGTITVSDTNGQTFNFSASGSQSYQQVVQCSTAQDSSQTINNTATITVTGQTAQASASVTCTVRTISGTGAVHYFTEASTSETASSPIDFSTSAVEALVPDGSGGFQSYPGTGASGTFSVPNVPPGQYMLRVGNTYVVTDVNAVDLGNSANGRPTAAAVTQNSLVNVGVGNLEPWRSGDFLEFYAPGAGDWDFGTERFANSGNGPGEDDVSVNLSINLRALDGNFPRFHIDSTAGDHAYLVQLSQQITSSGTTYFTLTRTFALPLFSSVDGGSVSAGDYPPNTFARVTQLDSINVDFRGSQFLAALTADGNPNQTFTSALYGVESVPGTAAYAFNVVSADQLLVVLPTDGSDVTTGTMSYGPLPVASNFGHWVDFRDVRFQSQVTYQLPGTVSGTNFVNHLFWTTAGQPGVVGPPLSAPRTIKVDGANFFSDQTLAGLNPTITWSPPAIGFDNGIFAYYRLTIYELDVNAANNKTTRGPVIATLYTPNTSIVL